MSSLSRADWDGEAGLLDDRRYKWLIAGTVALGVAIAICSASLFQIINSHDWWLLLLTVIAAACAVSGIVYARLSSKPLRTLLAYFVVVATFGLFCGAIASLYAGRSVALTLITTAISVVLLGNIGVSFPQNLSYDPGVRSNVSRKRQWLAIALLVYIALIGINIFLVIFDFRFEALGNIQSWLGIAVFGSFVVLDVNRDMHQLKTPHNVIKAASSVFIDGLVIWSCLLALFGEGMVPVT